MRRRTLVALSTLFLVTLGTGFAGSALAGGPTSVLLVVPGEGRTASLYAGSTDYGDLIDLVGGYDVPAGSTTPPGTADDHGAAGTNDSSGPGVTLTWLMHDVDVWRVDRVYANAEGGPLISTQSSIGGGDLWATAPIWHRASRPKELVEALDHLGVGPAATSGADPIGAVPPRSVPPRSVPPRADAAPSAPKATAARDEGLTAGWIWGPAGLVLGSALTLTASRRRRRSIAPATTATAPDESEELVV